MLDLVEQLEELQQEVRVQRGEIENLQFQVKNPKQRGFSVTPATEKLSSKPTNELATLSSVDDSDSSQNASAPL